MLRSRLDALLSHEVSVHLLTHFNGAAQGLTVFRTGLAHYEGVQEGLGVFAEWAVGGLSGTRMRLLAGRVLAVDAMLDGAEFVDVYRMLADEYGLPRKPAFDVTARVFRSGGFAKDLIYLQGFRNVIELVSAGTSLTPFWIGKIATGHVEAIEELLQRGLVRRPCSSRSSCSATTSSAVSPASAVRPRSTKFSVWSDQAHDDRLLRQRHRA